VIAAVAIIVAGALAARSNAPDGDAAAAVATDPTVTSTTACAPQPYQPCGGSAAPFTDGRQCIDDHADYDGSAANGCEATPDASDGTRFSRRFTANLVPADDVDRYPTPVDDDFQLLCDGQFAVTLVAPAGGSMQVDLIVDGEIVDSAVSSGGQKATVTADDSACFTSEDRTVVTRVSWAGDVRTSEPYELRRSGSF
jgi:hypothetical protein